MTLTIIGKGDLHLLLSFIEGDFSSYELYLPPFEDELIQQQAVALPKYLKISSIHNPAWVNINNRRCSFNLADPGLVGEASIESLHKTVALAKKLEARVVVIHGAAYNAFTETREKALQLVAKRVRLLYDQQVNLCFENDVLWHNLYYYRRALLTNGHDFQDLQKYIGEKLRITADFEHFNVSFHFAEFVKNLGGEYSFLQKYSEISQKPFERDIQEFIKNNYHNLQAGFKRHLHDFFIQHQQQIEHIHINGSDCCNFIFNPKTTLPFLGEHLPLRFKQGEISDKLDYDYIASLLHLLPEQKEIQIALEIWPDDLNKYRAISLESKEILRSYLNK